MLILHLIYVKTYYYYVWSKANSLFEMVCEQDGHIWLGRVQGQGVVDGERTTSGHVYGRIMCACNGMRFPLLIQGDGGGS